MPKLDFSELSKHIGMQSKDMTEYLKSILEEQGDEFGVCLCLGGLKNIEAMRGALAMYFTIKDALIKKECEQLEDIVK